jgi:hypothetical protein
MTRIARVAALYLGFAGLLLCIVVWAAAGVVALAQPGRALTAGYGRDRGTLVNLTARADGAFWLQHFPKNLSTRLGLYVDAAGPLEFAGGSLRPWTFSDANRSQFVWHLGPPTLISTCLLAGAIIPGWLRRRHRIRRGLCLSCGYDLRGAVSDACPECGQSWRTQPPAA